MQSDDRESGARSSPAMRTQPHNLRRSRRCWARCSSTTRPSPGRRVPEGEHFYEPVHQRILRRLRERIGRGQLADARSLFHLFDEDPALRSWTARSISGASPGAETIINAVSFGQIIHDLRCGAADRDRRGDGAQGLRPANGRDRFRADRAGRARALRAGAGKARSGAAFAPSPRCSPARSGWSNRPTPRSAR